MSYLKKHNRNVLVYGGWQDDFPKLIKKYPVRVASNVYSDKDCGTVKTPTRKMKKCLF